ncbi:hypothetical protein H4R24_000710 [Coemansia sp. RSA 988]|nr:hypothetical protein H4R24_000710 [Coemansia sp. RSA 988]
MAKDETNPPIPSRAQRKHCHALRDTYFSCLDANNIEDPADRGKLCAKERENMFNSGCPKSWFTYFEELRAMKIKQERMYRDMPKRPVADRSR